MCSVYLWRERGMLRLGRLEIFSLEMFVSELVGQRFRFKRCF